MENDTKNIKQKPDWKLVEIKGITYFSERGYSILFKIADNEGYDFVIERNGEFKRINVKVAFNDKVKVNSWSISAPGNKTWRYKQYSVDIYLVWLPDKEKFIELDGTFLDGINSKSRTITRYIKETESS
ncbi:group I intron-associated PD-(D/E)XK endonuclease [Bacillus sp. FJAT-45350]|uniref:group I intron-associated PD-(D/E)XK endonuclease n=1 Tax=Bacillus sp. FJAT-45350 TaxID=2011014 RepID=UPI000BB8EF11|nr:group I intron-associated PD-(D/E)XK endonuclease [Bacillus sp. FJAT-45350]